MEEHEAGALMCVARLHMKTESEAVYFVIQGILVIFEPADEQRCGLGHRSGLSRKVNTC